jgi:SAM-dependent methyltransferase
MSTASNTAGDYEVYWSRLHDSAQYHPANRFRYWLIASRLRRYLKTGTSVLDMGCGHAGLLARLSSDFPSGHFAGCDISRNVIARNKVQHPEMGFFAADVTAEEFAGQAAGALGRSGFDIVISSEVIEHVENDAALLRNAVAALSPGGYLILTTQSGPRYRVDFELLHHLRHYDRAALEDMVKSAGLDIVEGFNCGFPVLTLQKIIANAMFSTVMKAAASSNRPPAIVRLIMAVMYVLMRVSPKWSGPQIVIVARRAAAVRG